MSIVIATYRSRREHLSVAIVSALAQTWRELEVIVADDTPEDDLRDFVAGFKDTRLCYRHNRPALGVARNHWAAFAQARGEYVAVLNHDDWLAPTFVERLAGVLQQRPDAALVFCDHWVIDMRGRRLDEHSARNSAAWGRMQLAEGMHRPFVDLIGNQTIPMAMGAVFRATALPPVLPADAGPAYDLWLAFLLCRSGGGAWYVRDRLSAWRTHHANLTSQGNLDWLLGSARCWQAMAEDTRFAAVHGSARRKAALGYYGCAVRSWASGRRVDCVRYALRSLRLLPTWKGGAACVLPLLPRRMAPPRWVRAGSAA